MAVASLPWLSPSSRYSAHVLVLAPLAACPFHTARERALLRSGASQGADPQ